MQQQQPAMRNSPSKNGSGGHSCNFIDTIWSPFVKSGAGISPNRSYALVSLLILLIVGAFVSTRLLLDPTVSHKTTLSLVVFAESKNSQCLCFFVGFFNFELLNIVLCHVRIFLLCIHMCRICRLAVLRSKESRIVRHVSIVGPIHDFCFVSQISCHALLFTSVHAF